MKSVKRVLAVVVVIVFVGVFADDANGQIFRRSSRPNYRTASKKPVPQEAKMVAFVKREQSMVVGESRSDFDCFTDVDLQFFRQSNGPCQQIAAALTEDMVFIKLLGEIRTLDSNAQKRIFSKATATYKPTWRQLGRISSQGQTVSGQQAERMVASTVVSTAKKMLAKPQAQLETEAKRKNDARSSGRSSFKLVP